MSLKRNIIASYASQAYVVAAGILMLPLYLEYMGVEAFGLVGFFGVLQAWFGLLDIGLTPTVARETARYCGGGSDAASYRRTMRALERAFLGIGVVGGVALLLAAGPIAHHWLNVDTLPLGEVRFALQIMAVTVALRWIGGLYRGVVSGSERLVWLGGYTAAIASLRFVGVLPVLVWVGATPSVFFAYQLVVALVEAAGLALKSHGLMPPAPPGGDAPASLASLRDVIRFSLAVAFTSSTWMLVTQADKFLLSKLLPLSDYGYFSLAVLVAAGVITISGPVSVAVLPRMAKLEAAGDGAGLLTLYREATRVVVVMAGAAATVLFFLAEPLVEVWTGDRRAALAAAPILQLYAVGNAIFSVSAFAYYLQYAKGELRLHVVGNVWFIALLLPAMVLAVTDYGAIGAARVWLAMNLAYFVAWVPLVHRRLAPRLHGRWLGDVLAIAAVMAAAGFGAQRSYEHSDRALWEVAQILAAGAIVLACGLAASLLVKRGATRGQG